MTLLEAARLGAQMLRLEAHLHRENFNRKKGEPLDAAAEAIEVSILEHKKNEEYFVGLSR